MDNLRKSYCVVCGPPSWIWLEVDFHNPTASAPACQRSRPLWGWVIDDLTNIHGPVFTEEATLPPIYQSWVINHTLNVGRRGGDGLSIDAGCNCTFQILDTLFRFETEARQRRLW